jgi:hypothetical protein
MRYIALIALVTVALIASAVPVSATYTHYTNDPAYFDEITGLVLDDPYGVGECPNGGCIVYIGVAFGDDHYSLEKAGYPFARTRSYLAVRYPPGTIDRFAFDLDAAAQLLANGLTMSQLDWLWYQG